MSASNSVKVKVWGSWACFTRPEMKVERVSYPIMTPSAARGILEAILWKPEFRWVVHRIMVLKEIKFQPVRRNEIQKVVSIDSAKSWMEDPNSYEPFYADAAGRAEGSNRTQRNTLALKNVEYVIEAGVILSPLAANSRGRRLDEDEQPGPNTITKYVSMFNRRVEKGQCFHRPYLGCREFAADFGPVDGSEKPVQDSRDLGLMLYDIVYSAEGNRPVFFDAKGFFVNGELDADPARAIADSATRDEVIQCSYRG